MDFLSAHVQVIADFWPSSFYGKIIAKKRNKHTMRKFLLLLMFSAAICEAADKPPALPGNPASWLDNKPLSWSQLHGKVVMLNVWTFG